MLQQTMHQTANKMTAVAAPVHGLDAYGPSGQARKVPMSKVKGGIGVFSPSCLFVYAQSGAEKLHRFTKQPFL